MATVKETIEGASLAISNNPFSQQQGAVRRFVVTEMDGPEDQRLYEAINAVGIQEGDPHPLAAFLSAGVPRASGNIGSKDAIVTVDYSVLSLEGQEEQKKNDDTPKPTIEYTNVFKQVSVEKDFNGKLVLTYKPGNTTVPVGSPTFSVFVEAFSLGETPSSPGDVWVETNLEAGASAIAAGPGGPVTAEVVESAPVQRYTIVGTEDALRPFIGGVNLSTGTRFLSNILNQDVWHGGEPYSWRSALSASSDDGGKTWRLIMEFEYDPDGHNPVLVYVDKETGLAAPDYTLPPPIPGKRGNGSYRLNRYRLGRYADLFKGI